MDQMTASALINAGSRVLQTAAMAEAQPISSGLTNNGWFGLGNEGMTVNYGGSGLNLQGGAAAGVPLWALAAAAVAAYLIWGK